MVNLRSGNVAGQRTEGEFYARNHKMLPEECRNEKTEKIKGSLNSRSSTALITSKVMDSIVVNDTFKKLNLSKWCFKIWPKDFSVTIEGFTPENLETGKYSRSSKIVERFTPQFLKSSTGTNYILIGDIDQSMAKIYRYPDSLIKKFRRGFPPNWMQILKVFYETAKSNGQFETSILDQIITETSSNLSESHSSVFTPKTKNNFLGIPLENSKLSEDKSIKNDFKLINNHSKLPVDSEICPITRKPDEKNENSVPVLGFEAETQLEEDVFETAPLPSITDENPNAERFFTNRLSSKFKEFQAKNTSTPLTKKRTKKNSKRENLKQKFDAEAKKSVKEPSSVFDFVSESDNDDSPPKKVKMVHKTTKSGSKLPRETKNGSDLLQGTKNGSSLPQETKNGSKLLPEAKNCSNSPQKTTPKTINASEKRKYVSKKDKFQAILDSMSLPSSEYKIQTTRFGRTVKPPMAGWNGQRICYDIYGEPLEYENGSTDFKCKFDQPMVDLTAIGKKLKIKEYKNDIKLPKRRLTKKFKVI